MQIDLIKVTDDNQIDPRPFVRHYWGVDEPPAPDEASKELRSLIEQVDELRRQPPSDENTKRIRELISMVCIDMLGPPEKFAVHNTVRSRFNRTLRAAAPQHHRLKQHVLPQQHRLVRGRPVIITKGQLIEHVDELRKKAEQGVLEVRTVLGNRIVDLETLKPREMDVTPPAPNFPLDSVQKDVTNLGGVFIPPFDGAKPITDDPLLLQSELKDGEVQGAIDQFSIPPTIDAQQKSVPPVEETKIDADSTETTEELPEEVIPGEDNEPEVPSTEAVTQPITKKKGGKKQ